MTLAFTTQHEHTVPQLRAAVEALLEQFSDQIEDKLDRVVVRSVDED